MQFDIDNLNPGVWFTMEGGGQVCIRVCDGDSLRAIRKVTTKKRAEIKKIDNLMQRLSYEETNDDLQEEMIWDYCIVDWKDINDAKNEPIPCTKANKLLLVGKSITFAKFVGDCLNKLREQFEEDEKEEEKN